jgi:hypothetical protein
MCDLLFHPTSALVGRYEIERELGQDRLELAAICLFRVFQRR